MSVIGIQNPPYQLLREIPISFVIPRSPLQDLAQFPRWLAYVSFGQDYEWPYGMNRCHKIVGVGAQTWSGR